MVPRTHRKPSRLALPGVVLALATTLAACGDFTEVTPAPSGQDPLTWSAVNIPESNIMAAVEQVDGLVADTMKSTGIPGVAVAIVQGDQVLLSRGYGVREVGTDTPVNADTAFQLASVSKPIGATVVASAVGAGAVSWDDPVSKYLPYFQTSDPYVTANATIGDMYAMRSGLPAGAGDDLEEMGYDRKQIIERFKYLPLTPFRTTSQYTNFGLTAGAEAVATATGKPWEALSRELIYQPLGMTRTTSVYDEFMAQDNRATLHVPSDDAWVANGNRDEQAQAPAGQVSSTANDMARWMSMSLGNGEYDGRRIVDAATLQESRVPRIASHEQADPAARTPFYGYGIAIRTDGTGRVRYGFSGAYSQGAATHFTLLPDQKLGVAVLTNAYPIGAAEAIAWQFLDLVETGVTPVDWLAVEGKEFAEALKTTPLPPAPTNPAPPAPLATYAGTYANDYYGTVTVTVNADGTGLDIVAGPAQYPLTVKPYDGNVFAVQTPRGAMPTAEFQVDNGVAVSVEIAMLKAPGQQVLTRQ